MGATGIVENGYRGAITGLGVVAPTGNTVDEHWQAVLAGRSAIGAVAEFQSAGYPVHLGGQVRGFEPKLRVPSRLIPQTDRWTQFGIEASNAALADAGAEVDRIGEYDMAVVTASSSGGTEFGQREIEALWNKHPSYVGVYQSIAWFYAATTGQLSILHGMRGPCGVVCAEQAGGLDAIAQARRLIRTGTRLVLTGGTDAALCPYGLVAQMSSGLLSTSADPTRAYLPFDMEGAGFVPGEGGAILVMERVDPRHSRSYGTILGYAAGFDPPPGSPRPPALTRVIRSALDDARVNASEIDVVFADGAGVPALDLSEATAISTVFGPRAVPVTAAPKSLTGRLYAGGAPLDVATAFLAIRDGVIPHTAGTSRPGSRYHLDLVCTEPRSAVLRTAMVIARGYGGFTAVLVLAAGGR